MMGSRRCLFPKGMLQQWLMIVHLERALLRLTAPEDISEAVANIDVPVLGWSSNLIKLGGWKGLWGRLCPS